MVESYVAWNTIFDNYKLRLVPGHRFVENEFLNLDVKQTVARRHRAHASWAASGMRVLKGTREGGSVRVKGAFFDRWEGVENVGRDLGQRGLLITEIRREQSGQM